MKKSLFIYLIIALLTFQGIKASIPFLDCSKLEAWSGERGYAYGVRVVSDGKVYESVESYNNNWCKPVTDTKFWKYVGDCTNDVCANYQAWNGQTTYQAGAIVEYRGIIYQTSKRSFCQDPCDGNPWVAIGLCYTNCDTAEKFDINKVYVNNDIVIDNNNRIYIGQYYSQGIKPSEANGQGQAWKCIGQCYVVNVNHDCESVDTKNTFKVFQNTQVTVHATAPTRNDRDCRVIGSDTQTVLVTQDTTITFDCECEACVFVNNNQCSVSNTGDCYYPSDHQSYSLTVAAPTNSEQECYVDYVKLDNVVTSNQVNIPDVQVDHYISTLCHCEVCVTVQHDCSSISTDSYFCVVPGTTVTVTASPQTLPDRSCRVIGSSSQTIVVNTHTTISFDCECQACVFLNNDSCSVDNGNQCYYPSDNQGYQINVVAPTVTGLNCYVDSVKLDNTVDEDGIINIPSVQVDYHIDAQCHCEACVTVTHDCNSISTDSYFCVSPGTEVTVTATPQTLPDRSCRVIGSASQTQVINVHTTISFDCECQACVFLNNDSCSVNNGNQCYYPSDNQGYQINVVAPTVTGQNCYVDFVKLDNVIDNDGIISIPSVQVDYHINAKCHCEACVTVTHDCSSISTDSYFCVSPGTEVSVTATPQTQPDRSCRVIGSATQTQVINVHTTISFDCECQACVFLNNDSCSVNNGNQCYYPSDNQGYLINVVAPTVTGQNCYVDFVKLDNVIDNDGIISIPSVQVDYHINAKCHCEACVTVTHDCSSISTDSYFCVNPGTEVTVTATPQTLPDRSCHVIGSSSQTRTINVHTTISFDCECQACVFLNSNTCTFSVPNKCFYPSELADYTITVNAPTVTGKTCKIDSITPSSPNPIVLIDIVSDHTYSAVCSCTDNGCPAGNCQTAPIFNANKYYNKCDYVTCDGKLFVSLVNNNFCNDPCEGKPQWKFVEDCQCPDPTGCSNTANWSQSVTYKACNCAKYKFKNYDISSYTTEIVFCTDTDSFCQYPENYLNWKLQEVCNKTVTCFSCSYQSGKQYQRGQIVSRNGKFYIAKWTTSSTPGTEDPQWGSWRYLGNCQ